MVERKFSDYRVARNINTTSVSLSLSANIMEICIENELDLSAMSNRTVAPINVLQASLAIDLISCYNTLFSCALN